MKRKSELLIVMLLLGGGCAITEKPNLMLERPESQETLGQYVEMANEILDKTYIRLENASLHDINGVVDMPELLMHHLTYPCSSRLQNLPLV